MNQPRVDPVEKAPASARGGVSIAVRLQAGFALVLVLLAAVGALSWIGTGQLLTRMNSVNEDARRNELAMDMQGAVDQILLSVVKLSRSSDPEELKFESQAITESFSVYEKAAGQLEKSMAAGNAPAELREPLKFIKRSAVDAYAAIDDFSKKATSGAAAEDLAMLAESQVQGPQDMWVKSLADLRAVVSKVSREAAATAEASATTARYVTAAIVGLALLLGAAAAILISRSITRPLQTAVALSRRVANGDLSLELRSERNDEVGALLDALADMQRSLRRLLGDISQCAESIHVASAEVASGNADLSQRTELTSGNLQQTASSIEQLNGAVKQSASSADMANGLADLASQAAERGGKVVRQVVSSMAQIHTSNNKIADIIGVIDGIAFQTNILALNAAVEAAQAGEHGRGFAVVAGEVRNLAQGAASAAKEIKALIGASVERIESGSQLATDAGSTMSEIVAAVSKVRDVINEISVATAEQSTGIDQVNSAVLEVDRMTQQNAALVEQSAAAAESLREQAQYLNTLVGTFKLGHQAPAGDEAAAAA